MNLIEWGFLGVGLYILLSVPAAIWMGRYLRRTL